MGLDYAFTEVQPALDPYKNGHPEPVHCCQSLNLGADFVFDSQFFHGSYERPRCIFCAKPRRRLLCTTKRERTTKGTMWTTQKDTRNTREVSSLCFFGCGFEPFLYRP